MFQGKVVLVTGGTSGIGRAAAEAFAQAGARVVIAGRRAELGRQVEAELRKNGAEARFVQADVSLATDVDRLIASAVADFGRLDAALNNAATPDGTFALTADFTEEQFDRAVSMNLR
ncbi:MAG TPA: SDR family NAD(P)-dependent oxidoreductase, partial [Gemmatimonadales bacterium]|nr:SDR family NAD(P)-dependent oxidoreductase [Gemmatimonadales bacterium]